MQAFIANGWAHRVVDPDNSVHSAGKAEPLTTTWEIPPNIEFKKLQEAFTGTSTQETFCFTNGNIIDYFVTRTSLDGKAKSDFKSINVSALNMFRCGHVHEVMLGYDKHTYIQAKCWPEMKKDRIYKVVLCMDGDVFDVIGAKCGCPAGMGPCGSCKHIAAVCYALEEFSRFGQIPEFLTSTDKLQEWNKPRQKKLSIMPVQ